MAACMCKYTTRCFYSKGAVLILVWNLLATTTLLSYSHIISRYIPTSSLSLNSFIGIPLILIVVAAVLSGWLADAKFGNYRVSKAAFLLTFFGAVINCILVLVFESVLTEKSTVLVLISYCLLLSLTGAGSTAYVVGSLQLGLDQMPDASSSSITSFIAWLVCSLAAASWLNDTIDFVQEYCVEQAFVSSFFQIWSLFATLCISIVLISDFIFGSKWLTIEPKSPQSFKTIYRVLKFAAKHKAPIHRSALTYWEEDIPFRIDLGKSKYGGPFTTEQVEDVKTILRLLVVSLSFWAVGFSLTLQTNIHEVPAVNNSFTGLTTCSTYLLFSFTYSSWWSVIISTLLYEFTIYPLVRNKLPSILRRIGIASIMTTFTSFLCLILYIVIYIHTDENVTVLTFTASILHTIMSGLITQVFLTSVLEFACAQSPYNMRGLFVGYTIFLFLSTHFISVLFFKLFSYYCTSPYCCLVSLSMKTVLGLIGFILHCILARWYKRRVRDDIYSPHRIVEEVYDRYLAVPN